MRIEKGLKKMPGVAEASVNLASEQAAVTYDSTQTDLEQMMRKVEAIGYKAVPLMATSPTSFPASSPGDTDQAVVDHAEANGLMQRIAQEDERGQRRRAEIDRRRNLLVLGIALTVPILLLSMFFMNSFPGENFLLLALTTPVWAIVGWEFHRGALRSLRHFSANMDTLISLGSTAAYLMSVIVTFLPNIFGTMTLL